MKKQTRRDPKQVRPLVPLVLLDPAQFERVSAGHTTVDPIAGSFSALLSQEDPSNYPR